MNKRRLCIYQLLVLFFIVLLNEHALLADGPRKHSLSPIEHNQLCNDQEEFVDLSIDASNIYMIIFEIAKLDGHKNSILLELKRHMDQGHSIGEYHEIIKALEYAEKLLQKNYRVFDKNKYEFLYEQLGIIIGKVVNRDLRIEKCCLDSCHPCNNEKKKNHKTFHEKVLFKKDVVFEDDVKFKEDVTFEDDVKFKEDVKIKGNLVVEGTVSLEEVVIESLSVTDLFVENLSATDATIENLTVTGCIETPCITGVSIVEIIGTLSVTDAIITNATIENLSVTNEVVENLKVLSCMDSLCVNNLSVVNETINTLSITDAIIKNATIEN